MVKADISLPQELVGTVEAAAEAVYQVLGSSLSALVTNDMSIICNLAVEDEPVHAAYEKFFRTFNRMDTGDFMDVESMRVPSGEGVIMRPAVDARYVAKVPVNEVSEGLRYLLDHLEDEDDGEDDEE